jgi:hypothetical protein
MSDDSARAMSPQASARLMQELFDGLRLRLREPVVALFDALDDTLFDLGEHARSGDAQQLHFDALRECRRQRGGVQDLFLDMLGRAETSPPILRSRAQHAALSLVDPEDLEIELAIDGMASRATQRLSGLLHALNQRVGWLLGDEAMDAQRNPFGPLRIGRAFRDASASLEIDLQTRLVLYKIFERQVLGALEPGYAEINARLGAAGVLPNLGHARVRPPPAHHETAPAHESYENQKHEQTAPATQARSSFTLEPHEAELLTALRALLIREPEYDTNASHAAAQTSHRSVSAAEVMDRVLARWRLRSTAGAVASGQTAAGTPQRGQGLPPPRQFAAQLLAEANSAADGMPPSPQQSATVDIVGRVFDVIGNDRSVPTPMQPVMQTLLLPVLRASLRHPGMIAEHEHPLRQLIDLIAESAISWSPNTDPDGSFLGGLHESVQKIAACERTEEADRTIAQLRSQIEQSIRRAELAEQRAVEAHAGRERLWQARRQVNMALTEIVSGLTIPTWVRYLVTRPWMNCLVLIWLRQGPESAAYNEALGFAESLVWCANAGTDRVEQLRLRALLPVMETQLRQGLATVAYQDNEIRQLLSELQQYVRYRMGEMPSPAFIEAEAPAANAPGALSADPGVIEEQPLPQNVNPEVLARVRSLRPGTWFTFGKEDGSSERCKLSWISPYSGRCMFVNRNGLKIGERRPEDLALALESGVASIVENNQLMQRALAQALAQVRNGDTGDGEVKRA